MSDPIRHECGIALVRLKKPLNYYYETYGTPLYGFFKLFLLMEKQHNRGQDGAGVAAVKLEMPAGEPYMFRERNVKPNPLDTIFKALMKQYNRLIRDNVVHPEFPATVKTHFEFGAEVYLGHLRYGTSGGYHQAVCHPFFRRSSWPVRNLLLAGNFNMTNTPEMNRRLISIGQHPIFATDTQALLETIGFNLDEAHEDLYRLLRDQGLPGAEISRRILEEIDIAEVVRKSSANWDGGYLLVGALGNGDSFVLRDPHGIRPGFYFEDDEVVAAASERAPLMTVFGKRIDEVKEIPAGGMMVVKRDGALRHEVIRQPAPTPTSCTFERIYFSRGNDADIYRERKQLGANLAPKIWQAIDGDLEHAVFSYIPNTAETAYLGLMDELRRVRRREVKKEILSAARDGSLDEALIDRLILSNWPRGEKIAHKDVKLRTFISQEKWRSDLVSHVYDVTYGLVTPEDTLVCVDDSIVRGTTLKQSILKILSSLNPRRIIIASTAPQIRYPDCYGIDMSELGRFVAFQAMVALLEERGSTGQLREVYLRCLEQSDRPPEQMVNHVRALYDLFTEEEIAAKISALVRPRDVPWTGKVEILFQSVEGLHAALPRHAGDWYFTGRYPTPGGYRVLNQAFINFYEKKAKRSY